MLFRYFPWPVPAVFVWMFAWGTYYIALGLGLGLHSAFILSLSISLLMGICGVSWWRKVFIAGGFPVSFVIMASSDAVAHMPAWLWLIPLSLLLWIYPVRAWKDAPLFPTPQDALTDLNTKAPLPEGALVMDAGCGLGHGLFALRTAYPKAELIGVEWSWLLKFVCQLRCPWARIVRANIWDLSWSSFDMVYVFQRPESMHRASDKALQELKPGAWLVSLEFEAEVLVSSAQIQTSGGKMVWLYQVPLKLKNAGDC